MASTTEALDRALIRALILNFKIENDGCGPTLRELIDLYAEKRQRIASTSTMYRVVKNICKTNDWTWNGQAGRIVTKGEWRDYLDS